MKPQLEQQYLKDLFNYDSDTGIFTWKVKRKGTRGVGSQAGYKEKTGYITIRIDGINYAAHRLAWAYEHGYWPSLDLDHIDCNRSNNRLSNLREATRSQNTCNTKISSNNTSGIKGVMWHKRNKKWCATIMLNQKAKWLGYFDNIEEAQHAVEAARSELHGEFARS